MTKAVVNSNYIQLFLPYVFIILASPAVVIILYVFLVHNGMNTFIMYTINHGFDNSMMNILQSYNSDCSETVPLSPDILRLLAKVLNSQSPPSLFTQALLLFTQITIVHSKANFIVFKIAL